jgi:hypothetical protein
MKRKKITYLIFFSFMLYNLSSSAYTPIDTLIIKKPKVRTLKDKIFNSPLVLKTSLTGLLWGAIYPPFTAEYRLIAEITSGKKQSEQIAISVLGKNLFYKALEKASNIPTDYIFKVSGWRLQYAHKFYLVNRRHYAPYGFYVGPLVSYTDAHISVGLNRYYHQTYYDFRHLNADIIAGLQVGKMNRLTLDIYAGAGYKTNKVFYHATTYSIIPYDTSGFGDIYNTHLNVVFGINLGYSF